MVSVERPALKPCWLSKEIQRRIREAHVICQELKKRKDENENRSEQAESTHSPQNQQQEEDCLQIIYESDPEDI